MDIATDVAERGIAGGKVTKVTVRLTRVDNQIIILVNGKVAVDRGVDGDPVLDESYDLPLEAGRNRILVIGINWGGPTHFVGEIHAKRSNGTDVVVGSWDYGPAGAGGGTVKRYEFEVQK